MNTPLLATQMKEDYTCEEKMEIEDLQLDIVNDQSTDLDHEESRGTFDSLPIPKQLVAAETHKPSAKEKNARKIKTVLDAVTRWRNLYNGFVDPETGKEVKMKLEDAAKVVGLPKKSLDDYLLQIRFGKKHGFDFVTHADESIGFLRAFVKKQKIYHRQSESVKKSRNLFLVTLLK